MMNNRARVLQDRHACLCGGRLKDPAGFDRERERERDGEGRKYEVGAEP